MIQDVNVTITLSDEVSSLLKKTPEARAFRLRSWSSATYKTSGWPEELLKRRFFRSINDSFPEVFWARYKLLKSQLDHHTLTAPDHEEFLKMVDQVERKHTARLGAIAQLANIRGITFLEL